MFELLGNDLSLDKLLNVVIRNQYSLALWRMPHETHQSLIVDFNTPKVAKHSDIDSVSGFLVNPFEFSHPVSPLVIKPSFFLDTRQRSVISEDVDDNQINSFVHLVEESERFTISTTDKYIATSEAIAYQKMVESALCEMKEGVFKKVVLARTKQLRLDGISVRHFFESVCSKFGEAFCSVVYTPEYGLWIGASPETLITASDTSFSTTALAGTKQLKKELNTCDITWTQKEIEEQAMVSRYVINCFKKLRFRMFEEQGPKTTLIGNLAHLKTLFTVDLSKNHHHRLAVEMLNLLHPTSAVCGMSFHKAFDFIMQHEKFARSLFTGFLGPHNLAGSTDLFVNIRCISIVEGRATLYAGAGITEDSIPEKEYRETEMKMNALMDVLQSLNKVC